MSEDFSDYEITEEEKTAFTSIATKLCNLAVDRGWDDKPREKGTQIALMHSELSEALEGVRKDLQDDHLPQYKSEVVEMADTIIRILHYCIKYDLPIAEALAAKHYYNGHRADHSREARASANGKAF